MQNLPTTDPIPHVKQAQQKLHQLLEHLREDATKVDDPRAAALFETSAEVLTGLERAFEHFGVVGRVKARNSGREAGQRFFGGGVGSFGFARERSSA